MSVISSYPNYFNDAWFEELDELIEDYLLNCESPPRHSIWLAPNESEFKRAHAICRRLALLPKGFSPEARSMMEELLTRWANIDRPKALWSKLGRVSAVDPQVRDDLQRLRDLGMFNVELLERLSKSGLLKLPKMTGRPAGKRDMGLLRQVTCRAEGREAIAPAQCFPQRCCTRVRVRT
jgi:hypothetical protein